MGSFCELNISMHTDWALGLLLRGVRRTSIGNPSLGAACDWQSEIDPDKAPNPNPTDPKDKPTRDTREDPAPNPDAGGNLPDTSTREKSKSFDAT